MWRCRRAPVDACAVTAVPTASADRSAPGAGRCTISPGSAPLRVSTIAQLAPVGQAQHAGVAGLAAAVRDRTRCGRAGCRARRRAVTVASQCSQARVFAEQLFGHGRSSRCARSDCLGTAPPSRSFPASTSPRGVANVARSAGAGAARECHAAQPQHVARRGRARRAAPAPQRDARRRHRLRRMRGPATAISVGSAPPQSSRPSSRTVMLPARAGLAGVSRDGGHRRRRGRWPAVDQPPAAHVEHRSLRATACTQPRPARAHAVAQRRVVQPEPARAAPARGASRVDRDDLEVGVGEALRWRSPAAGCACPSADAGRPARV